MNYIRGAVNAISAPYQYYKELPPINPSTLTGAIDVIVIQRPTSSGETELACSPFHVRFGKWQVLRPSDKKVNVSVNGQPIPYRMKIGEAGEAFFVFETDGDVPPDLITSPILLPTRPEEEAADAQADATASRFGAKEAYTSDDASASEKGPEHASELTSEQEVQHDSQEPEFLDLNAGNGHARHPKGTEEPWHDVNLTPTQKFHQPSFLRHSASRSTIQPRRSPVEPATHPSLSLPSPPISRSPSPELNEQNNRVDQALRNLDREVKLPEVKYHPDVALDLNGYHAHAKDTSDQTVHASDSEQYQFPSLRPPPRTSTSTLPRPEIQSAIHSTNNSSPSDTDSESEINRLPSSSNHHRLRATSEPPPDLDDHIRPPTDSDFVYNSSQDSPSGSRITATHPLKLESQLPSSPGVQEYSWEWGAFPTPSPVKTTFGKGGRVEGWKAKARQFDNLVQKEASDEDTLADTHGRLSAKIGDDTTFLLTADHKSFNFQLSLVPLESLESCSGEKGKGKAVAEPSWFADYDEFSKRFEEGKLTFSRFMQDDSLHTNPTLVIKWVDRQYLMLRDNPSLYDALSSWRTNTSNEPDDEELVNETRHTRSKSEPPTPEQKARAEAERPEDEAAGGKKPGTLSWVQWWSRTRPRDTGTGIPLGARPVLRPVASEPPPAGAGATKTPPFVLNKEALKKLSEQKLAKWELETAPTFPPTPNEIALAEETPRPSAQVPAVEQQPRPPRRFAKTLRLTSDQLKTLNLKPGANTITFSISSGVIACTARIFVWEHTDHVVISDIDGTITKSDGLGHVFAMIGRDWTHVGVAKLYTDIVRNGYKIMYLTSRAIGQADATRGYLKGIKQNDYQLPEGPVIMSPDRLMASLHREVIMRKPELFKMACLRDIQRLFGEHAKNPFYAGFGNRITDALSYRSVNVPSARIFTIDSAGEVKMELLELAGYKSSYIHMTDLVDQMFPPIHKKWTPEYTDFNYWKIPVPEYPLPDLTPPSPTLSARSDTSNRSALAKLRNFRLMGSRTNSLTSPPSELANDVNSSYNNNGLSADPNRDSHLRQVSSFERVVSGLRRSVSPSSASRASYALDSDSESDVDGPQKTRRKSRRRSMTSMPGSLDEIHFGMDDDDDDDVHWEGGDRIDGDGYDSGGDGYEDDGDEEYEDNETYEGEVDEEMAIDEDLLAATEMKKIPFL